MEKHTPTPWSPIGCDIYSPTNSPHEENKTVAQCTYDEDAAFIVRAVNSHKELIYQLKNMGLSFHLRTRNHSRHRFDKCPIETCRRIRESIAKAEGKP